MIWKLKVLNDAMAKMPRTTNFALTFSTWKVRKYLALRIANLTCHLETNKNHIGQIESTLFVYKLKQGPLELELLVVL